ncbi:class I SAM-dependent RNA methyltransferase [Qipengyuania sp.]|uniref:class I SAM-dependent RNA methyltransferase n=1 Tax=Qipengyuania sp. TaxID=2004515 RepID=UPI003734D200
MTDDEPIIRIAAKGDGVTASGRHVPGTVPGDLVRPDGTTEAGPHRAVPPCRHFGVCGGCQLQHADEEALRQFVTDRVTNAAAGHGIEPDVLLETHLSPPRSRRRASLRGSSSAGGVILGFNERASNRIVNLRECHVLLPSLFDLVAPLRAMFWELRGKAPLEVWLTQGDQGIDCVIKGLPAETLAEREQLVDFAQTHTLARLALDDGYGIECLWEPQPVTISLGGVAVGLPPDSFLQATLDGERRLTEDVATFLSDALTVADLFSGLGTFAFALPSTTRVLAVEAARDAHLACKTAAGRARRQVYAMHRDLFRNPLRAEELDRFDAVVLDPPRAGAREQIAQIAASNVSRVAYVSCNPATWARDAAMLCEAGFRLAILRPVGQFRWSTHVELTSLFVR